MKILYEDSFLVLAEKSPGCLSEDGPSPNSMPALLREHYRSLGKQDYIASVHRLDKIVGGLMIYSRSPKATGKLIAAVAEHQVTKEYLAVLKGIPKEPEGVLRDLLFHDSSKNKTFVVKRERKGVREAELSYSLLETSGDLSLLRIRLHTGRTHQIRAQFSSRGLPLLGDIRYGSKDPACGCALWSFHLAFSHPITGKEVDYSMMPPVEYPWNLFSLTSGKSPL